MSKSGDNPALISRLSISKAAVWCGPAVLDSLPLKLLLANID